MPPQTTPKAINIDGISITQALAVLQHHIATDVHAQPALLANLQKLRAGIEGTPDRPMSSSESPGMRAAKDHTRPEFQHSPQRQRQGHPTRPEQPSPGQVAAGRHSAGEQ